MSRESDQTRRHRLRTKANAEQELAEVRDLRERLGEVFIKLARAAAMGETVELTAWEIEPLLPALRAAIHQSQLEGNRR